MNIFLKFNNKKVDNWVLWKQANLAWQSENKSTLNIQTSLDTWLGARKISLVRSGVSHGMDIIRQPKGHGKCKG